MNIAFSDARPAFRESNLTVVFAASIDGRPVDCAISVEALEDHFDVRVIGEKGWIAAFMAGRGRIVDTAREHLLISNGAPVLLKSGHFPFPNAVASAKM